MNQKQRFRFEPEEIEELKKHYNVDTPEEALEKWAYNEFGMKWNCGNVLGRVGKTFVDVIEVH